MSGLVVPSNGPCGALKLVVGKSFSKEGPKFSKKTTRYAYLDAVGLHLL